MVLLLEALVYVGFELGGIDIFEPLVGLRGVVCIHFTAPVGLFRGMSILYNKPARIARGGGDFVGERGKGKPPPEAGVGKNIVKINKKMWT